MDMVGSKMKNSHKGTNAWTASESDFDQQLIIDLGTVKNITRVATQGRAHSQEYVQEYHISYGSNGLDYVQYKAAGGEVKVKSCHKRNGDGAMVCMEHLVLLFLVVN